MGYIAVSSVRNEEKFISTAISSVLEQSLPPDTFVVVDDGSNDNTGSVANACGVIVLRIDVPRSAVRGLNRVYAFKKGVAHAAKLCPSWDFLLSVDADSVLPRKYVERLVERMKESSSLGIIGGMPRPGWIRLKRVTNGARLYRRECWDDIDGLDDWTAFDTHALLKARQMGWETRTFQDVEYSSLRSWTQTSMRRWIFRGWERRSFGFPWWHTWLAAGKNVVAAHPPIIGVVTMVLAHPASPWSRAPKLDKDWIKSLALWETRNFFRARQE